MFEFDVLKFIVDVMEYMQFINIFNMIKDVNVFVYIFCLIVYSFVVFIKIQTLF